MKVCDRCFYRDGSYTKATAIIQVAEESSELCESCKEEVRDFIRQPKKYRIVKKKEKKLKGD